LKEKSKLDIIENFIELNIKQIEFSPRFKSKKKRTSNPLFSLVGESIKESISELEIDFEDAPNYIKNAEKQLIEKNVSKNLKNLILSMISENPTKRPTAKQIIKKLNEIPIENEELLRMERIKELEKLQEERLEEERILKIENSFKFQNFIQNKKYRELLSNFLQKERSEENLKFIEYVEIFRELKTDQERMNNSMEIFEVFFNVESKYELNVSQNVQKKIKENLKKLQKEGICPNDIFDSLFDEIMIQTLNDKFNRFKNTLEFQTLYENEKKKKK
jgi:serine/threonine protein kinase